MFQRKHWWLNPLYQHHFLTPQATKLVVTSFLSFPLLNIAHHDCSPKAFYFLFPKKLDAWINIKKNCADGYIKKKNILNDRKVQYSWKYQVYYNSSMLFSSYMFSFLVSKAISNSYAYSSFQDGTKRISQHTSISSLLQMLASIFKLRTFESLGPKDLCCPENSRVFLLN